MACKISLVIEVRFDYNYLMKLMPLWNLGLIGMPSGRNFLCQTSDEADNLTADKTTDF